MNVLMKGCDMEKLSIKINDLLMIDLKNDIEITYSDSIETNENNRDNTAANKYIDGVKDILRKIWKVFKIILKPNFPI